MTQPPDRNERATTLAAASRLNASMTELRDELHALRTYGRRNRHLIVGLAVSLVLDLALSVVVAFVAVAANNANSLAHQNQQAQVQTCEAGNQARAISVQLWTYVLDVSAKQPENQTPERRRQIADFRGYLTTAYAPRDCQAGG